MVARARFHWPDGPKGLVQAVTPNLGPKIVTKMIFDVKDDHALHFRPDNLCEPALIERFCRDKSIRDAVTKIAKKSMLEGDPSIHGQPDKELRKLLARALAGKLPKVRTGSFTRFERMALFQITSQICAEFGITKGRSKYTSAPSCACDVAAAAWPDQVASGDAAVNAVKKAKRELWHEITAINVTETHIATTISVPFWGIGPYPVLMLNEHFMVAKEVVDYSAPLWFVEPGKEKQVLEQIAWSLNAIATSPPGSDRKLPPFPLPRPTRIP